jgi:hypothetical protein
VKVVGAVVLAMIVIAALYGAFSSVWDRGTTKGETKGNTANQIFECVQDHPEKGRQWCENQVQDSRFEVDSIAPELA